MCFYRPSWGMKINTILVFLSCLTTSPQPTSIGFTYSRPKLISFPHRALRLDLCNLIVFIGHLIVLLNEYKNFIGIAKGSIFDMFIELLPHHFSSRHPHSPAW